MSYNLLNPVHIIVAQSMTTSITSAAMFQNLRNNVNNSEHLGHKQSEDNFMIYKVQDGI
jgi:hypothetical protein